MEIPLLVSTPLVPKILSGQKTETRRLKGLEMLNSEPDAWEFDSQYYRDGKLWFTFIRDQSQCYNFPSPFGQPGDTLWMRENYFFSAEWDDIRPMDIPKSERFGFIADGPKPDWAGKTRPSIHMPRWICRQELKILSVKIHRVHEIDSRSCQKEGILIRPFDLFGLDADQREKKYNRHFENLWAEINGQESWNQNEWVTAISFTNK